MECGGVCGRWARVVDEAWIKKFMKCANGRKHGFTDNWTRKLDLKFQQCTYVRMEIQSATGRVFLP